MVSRGSVSSEGSELASAYLVQPISDEHKARMFKIVNPRRGAMLSVPGLTLKQNCDVADIMFERFKLDQFVGCITAEIEHRPIPFVFKTSETRALTELYIKWAPYIFNRIMRELKPPVQTYNKVSRLGWPYFTNPPNKQDYLSLDFSDLVHDSRALERYNGSFVGIGLRLQAESTKKEREFLFLTDDYQVVKRVVTRAEREIEVSGVGKRIASRFRGVNNMPLPNLFKQILDTAIHAVLLRYPAFHHDMFNKKLLPVTGFHMCFDVKHFERFTADAVRHRAQLLGGMYQKIGSLFNVIPYAVPTEGRRKFAYLWPNRDEGWSDQFASGDSAVAPVQKEIFTAIYGEFFRTTRGLSYEQAIELVWQGGDERLTIRNYGDDNSVNGHKPDVMAVFNHLKQYLHVEVEDPPKFLGFVWYGDELGWRLSKDSYLTKTYLNERAPYTNFRKYPNLGWVEKRKVYATLGHPEIAAEVFPFEDKILASQNLFWYEVEHRAANERSGADRVPGVLTPNWILGKDWAMTAEEKLQTGEFFGFMPPQTGPIIKLLVGEQWRKLLAY